MKFSVKVALPILFFFIISSCKKDVTSILSSGTWKVSNYTENGSDHTNDFSGYAFTFGSSGQFNVTYDIGSSYAGNWSEDTKNNKVTFTGSGTASMSKLIGTWNVLEKTSTDIKLSNVDVSESEQITFTKM